MPAQTPREIIITLRNAALAALANPEIARRLADLGYVIVGDQPAEFSAHMKSEIDSLRKSFRALGVKID